MKKEIVWICLALLLAACNTVQGIKTDAKEGGQAVGHGLQKAGQAIGNAVEKGGEAIKRTAE
ncbi:entericidin EcnAB [Chromobacterium subtsugae]|uniref:Entericidin EcnAB n=1 Tax=Chromobacterium subtsugae TaxID=251747 RepID=A0ABS7FJ88_9NEIS|nr:MULTISPECIES: entericidin EcnAB [Chromobacterium]KUM02893.1 entericidin EcnAB [Chromobacterium subtsugae]KZE84173.1 entericidin EcnAB [Chromobacterium sp. F49]MBW7568632.1 entericidin EcnAB [Chromobacterium subtsugae]MBW8290145.1 entericidin EcnAB [Chromobacterium subtsugae]WSE93616.1 entericidin EcnAB [Chromobacterium subtsugae]